MNFTRTESGATLVNLADAANPAWMRLHDASGRCYSTVLAGPVYSGKSAMLAYLQHAALEADVNVALIDPLGPGAAESADALRGVHAAMKDRQSTGIRTPYLVAVDNTVHLTADWRLSKILNELVDLGPALGVGLIYTVETVRGATKGHVPSRADNVIVLGTRPEPGGGAAEYGIRGGDLTSDAPAHFRDPFSTGPVPFTPATHQAA